MVGSVVRIGGFDDELNSDTTALWYKFRVEKTEKYKEVKEW